MRLSREQWEALHKQAESPQRNPKAEASCERGRQMLVEMKRQGYVKLQPGGYIVSEGKTDLHN